MPWEYDKMLLKKGERERGWAYLNRAVRSSVSTSTARGAAGVAQGPSLTTLWGESHLLLLRSWDGWPSG